MASRVRVFVVVVAAVVAASLLPTIVECRVRRYKFNVVMKNMTRLCTTKSIVTVNGMFPGPTIYAREDDNLLVEVVNNVHYNVTIHWHGIRQIRTGFADGPAYVTQCPIQSGQRYVYNFTVTGQRGTLLWHAHILWLRATVHGAMVILPKLHVPYPFPAPHKEVIIILGEWWNSDVEAVIDEALASGLSPNVSDAHTINGYPGPMSECASQDGGGYKFKVKSGNKYLLRIVNAALNEELFFRVSGHRLTIVETDGIYTKPFVTDTILVGPGQTTNAILSADASPGRYAITASTFLDTPIPVDKAPATAVIRYTPTPTTTTTTATLDPPPAVNATPVASAFIDSLRSLNSADYPARVPMEVDHSLLFAVGVGVNPCETCPGGFRVVADINNVTFVMPKVGILEAYYYGTKGVFTDDFPGRPPRRYDYTDMNNTDMPLGEMRTTMGTRVYTVKYNQTVEVVLQGTSLVAPENHPFHLHGFNFFAVARGMGNFDEVESRKTFNLVDPIERNTIGVPSAGWVAIRFRADNPGVWFMHCHLEIHTTWGLKMAFLVDNGDGPDQSLLPPPSDLPTC